MTDTDTDALTDAGTDAGTDADTDADTDAVTDADAGTVDYLPRDATAVSAVSLLDSRHGLSRKTQSR